MGHHQLLLYLAARLGVVAGLLLVAAAALQVGAGVLLAAGGVHLQAEVAPLLGVGRLPLVVEGRPQVEVAAFRLRVAGVGRRLGVHPVVGHVSGVLLSVVRALWLYL